MQKLFQTDETFTSLAMEIRELMNVDTIITNADAMIVACTRGERLNHFHEGAFLSLKNRQEMIMTEELSKKLLGVKEGIVIPLMIAEVPVGVLGINGDPNVVKFYAPIVRKLSELYLKNAIDQMSQEKKTRNLELFIYDWLNENLSDQQLIERSKFFQIDINNYRQVISIKLPFKTNEFSFQELEMLKDRWNGNRDTIIVRWGQGKLLILDQGLERIELEQKLQPFIVKLKDDFDKNVYVGVGQILNYTELATSYKQAEESCIIAQTEKRIIFEEDLRFEMVQYELNEKTKKMFIERTIAPILTDETLLETLDCWLQNNMSIQNTAEALDIHKNTLYYRLDKISTMTDLDVNDVDHIVLLYMSNRFLKEVG